MSETRRVVRKEDHVSVERLHKVPLNLLPVLAEKKVFQKLEHNGYITLRPVLCIYSGNHITRLQYSCYSYEQSGAA